MSTKIHNAFRIKGPLNVAIPLLQEVRAEIEPIAAKMMESAAYKKIWELSLDLVVHGMNDKKVAKRYPYTAAPSRMAHLQTLMRQNPLLWGEVLVTAWARHAEFVQGGIGTDHACFCEFQVMLFPLNGDTLGMMFGNEKFFPYLLNAPGVEKYYYWNNSDEPEDISKEEWDLRGADWKSAMPSGIPSRDGVFYQMLSADAMLIPYPTDKGMEQFIVQTRDKTVSLLVKKKLETSCYKRLLKVRTEEHPVSVAVEACEQAKLEMGKGSARTGRLLAKYEALVPRSWDECRWFLSAGKNF